MELNFESKVIRKLNKRILWLLMLGYFISILDRANISVASLTMNDELGFSPMVYGYGASLFVIGYFVFQVPSNIILERVGARWWLPRIMISWGLVTVGMIFINGKTSFYGMRFLLGIVEAGFYPGIIFYLSLFYPYQHRTKAIALFQVASPFSLMIGIPLIGFFFKMHGFLGLHGWQHIFLFTGVPAVILGVLYITYLRSSIGQTKWLLKEEKEWLTKEIEKETMGKPKARVKFYEVFVESQVWLATLILFCINVGFYSVVFWIPQIVKSVGNHNNLVTTLFSGIPYAFTTFAVVLVSRHSDKSGERKKHLSFCLIASTLGFYLTSISTGIPFVLFGLSLATGGLLAAMPVLWTFPISMFSGVAAATAIATINSIGALGGIIGPSVIGFAAEKTGKPASGLVVVALFMFVAFVISLFLKIHGKEIKEVRNPLQKISNVRL